MSVETGVLARMLKDPDGRTPPRLICLMSRDTSLEAWLRPSSTFCSCRPSRGLLPIFNDCSDVSGTSAPASTDLIQIEWSHDTCQLNYDM
jgi:hypothetical protein